MHISTVKPYKPSQKTLEKIESGELLLKHKDFKKMLHNLSPTNTAGTPFKSNALKDIWTTVLPFTNEQMNRMEEEVKVNIKHLAIKGIMTFFRSNIDTFLGEHTMRYEVYEEAKLEYLLRHEGRSAFYITEEEEGVMYDLLESLFISSSEKVFLSKYYFKNVEKFDMSKNEMDSVLFTFYQKCMLIFNDFNVNVGDNLYDKWISYLEFGLTEKHKEFYSLAKFKPYSNFVLWYCNEVKEHGWLDDEDGLIFVDYFLNFYKYLDRIKELESEETILKIGEFVEFAKENVDVEKLYDKHKEMHIELFRIHEELKATETLSEI
mgnify:CR=1 FL=1